MKALPAWPVVLAPPLPWFPAGPSGLQGPDGGLEKIGGFDCLEIAWKQDWGHTLLSSDVHVPIPPSCPGLCLWSPGFLADFVVLAM